MSTTAFIIQIIVTILGPIISATTFNYLGKKGIIMLIILTLVMNVLLYLYT
jgi:hypothetical protein